MKIVIKWAFFFEIGFKFGKAHVKTMQTEEPKTIQNSLICSDNPAIKYRTLTELAGFSIDSPEVLELKSKILEMPDVKKVFALMHPDGYWLQKNTRTGITSGDGVEYGAFATTHFILSYLSEMGLSKEHPKIALAAERYLNLVQPDGDWWNHLSCLSGLNIRTFIRLGYRNDQRLQSSINLMLKTNRSDKGYLCDMHERRSKKKKSCYRGTLKMLLAFSELPEYYHHPRVLQLIDYFLERNGIYNSSKTEYVNSDITRFSFPVIWRANTWELLYAFSKMGYGKDKRLHDAWKLIESKTQSNGFINLDWSPVQCPINFGKREKPNEWLSLYIELSKKYKSER